MKAIFATVIFSIATAVGFCDDVMISHHPVTVMPVDMKLTTVPVSKQSFGYVRLGVGDKDATHTFETIPGLGIGYRYGLKNSAVDISANYTSQFIGSHAVHTYFFTIPKATYLRYVSDDTQDQSFYYGAGLAWGGLKKEAEQRFNGLIPNVTVGYELNRKQAFHSFLEANLSQPVIFQKLNGPATKVSLPGPVAEISLGLGY